MPGQEFAPLPQTEPLLEEPPKGAGSTETDQLPDFTILTGEDADRAAAEEAGVDFIPDDELVSDEDFLRITAELRGMARTAPQPEGIDPATYEDIVERVLDEHFVPQESNQASPSEPK
jgi:hypothetical protein